MSHILHIQLQIQVECLWSLSLVTLLLLVTSTSSLPELTHGSSSVAATNSRCSVWCFSEALVHWCSTLRAISTHPSCSSLSWILIRFHCINFSFWSSTGNISDSCGRKFTMLCLMLLWSMSSLMHYFASDFHLFLLLQFILAFSSNAAWTTTWIWMMETVSGKWRTIVGLGTFLFWTVGE